nr:hypothetical protein Iba_chr01bCG6720 [Ipomoea batatas]
MHVILRRAFTFLDNWMIADSWNYKQCGKVCCTLDSGIKRPVKLPIENCSPTQSNTRNDCTASGIGPRQIDDEALLEFFIYLYSSRGVGEGRARLGGVAVGGAAAAVEVRRPVAVRGWKSGRWLRCAKKKNDRRRGMTCYLDDSPVSHCGGVLMATAVIAGRETLHFRDEYGFWGDYDGHSSVKGKKESEGFAVLAMFINGSGGGKPSAKMVFEEESNFRRKMTILLL